MTDTDTGGTDVTAEFKPTPEQRNALAMHGFYDRTNRAFLVQPTEVRNDGIIIYDLADTDTDHEDTVLAIYPSGSTGTFTKGANL